MLTKIDRTQVEQALADGFGVIAVMDGTGDKKSMWDPKDEGAVEEAKEEFKRLTAKGYLAFGVDPNTGEKREQVTEFKKSFRKLIFVPPVAGG
jgi:hypothetical protein